MAVRLGVPAIVLALAFTLIVPAATGAPSPAPAVAFVGPSGRTRVAAGDGTPLGRFDAFKAFSLQGDLLVGEYAPGAGPGVSKAPVVVGFDAATGDRRFAIREALLPTILDARGRVAFWAPYERDKQVNSLWVREIDGRVRRIVQFSNGRDLPGYDTGYEGEAGLLSTSFDRAGDFVALAEGNDVSLFIYDVYVVNVDTGRVRRITNDRKSRWPSMAPDGRRVAYQRELRKCGAPYMRAARIVVEGRRGKSERVLTDGSCRRWFANPRWVSDDAVVTYRYTRSADGQWKTDLATIDVATKARRMLTSTGDIAFVSADPQRGRIAYSRSGHDGFWTMRLSDGKVTRFAKGEFPHLSGDRGTL